MIALVSTLFLSTPSARRATLRDDLQRVVPRYFYPRPPRGGRPCSKQMVDYAATISIHALREEGDLRMSVALQHIFISIHALREEGDSKRCGNGVKR